VPFAAITGFADPFVRYGLRFQPVLEDAETTEAPATEPPAAPKPAAEAAEAPAQVASLDAFRRKPARD
jgi:hypothetical protein